MQLIKTKLLLYTSFQYFFNKKISLMKSILYLSYFMLSKYKSLLDRMESVNEIYSNGIK